MSFALRLDPKKRAAGRFIGRVRDELLKAFVEAKEERGLTQKGLADEWGVDSARVSRILNGEENLTLRSVAELACVLDREVDFALRKKKSVSATNGGPTAYQKVGNTSEWEAKPMNAKVGNAILQSAT